MSPAIFFINTNYFFYTNFCCLNYIRFTISLNPYLLTLFFVLNYFCPKLSLVYIFGFFTHLLASVWFLSVFVRCCQFLLASFRFCCFFPFLSVFVCLGIFLVLVLLSAHVKGISVYSMFFLILYIKRK